MNIGKDKAVALLRRDYPPQKLDVNPKPDVKEKFSWSPRSTFIVGVILAVLAVGVYLLVQYINFIRPPSLVIVEPQEEALVSESKLVVVGNTNTDATIKVNNQPVIVNEDGEFSVEISITEETSEIIVVAQTRSGKLTEVVRKIKVDF